MGVTFRPCKKHPGVNTCKQLQRVTRQVHPRKPTAGGTVELPA